MNLIDLLADVVDIVPDVKAHLKPETLEALKNANTYGRQLWKYCRDLYRTGDGGVFLTQFIEAIKNQMTRAWNDGAREVGVEPEEMTDIDLNELKAIIDSEYDHVIDLGEAIIASRGGTLAEFRQQFRNRVDLWVNRYEDAANRAKVYFGNRQRLVWTLGATEEHCETCAALNGMVAFASEWEQSGIRPQSPPNEILACGGWQCDCSLEITDQRRSPDALGRLMDIATAANIEEKSMKYDPDQPRVPAGSDRGGEWVRNEMIINGDIDPTIKNDAENAYDKSVNALPEIKDIFNGIDTTELNVREPIQFDEFTHKIKIDKFIANHPIEYNSGNKEVQDKMVQKSGEEVFIHEFGHVANRTVYEKIRQTFPDESDFNYYADKYQNAIREIRASSEHLSWYADFRGTEWIAERFNYEVMGYGSPLLINLMRKTIADL